MFPHARFLCRDATHSARRLDAYLSEVIQTFILSPSSIVQIIHNSPDLRGIYGLINRDDIEVNTVQNLGSSKDRFDSTSKPLSRFCATFDSVWKAAVAIQDRRKGTVPGQRASEFLRYVSAESLMQAAMLADAAMEAMAVVRFHETESFDLSLVPQVICQFLHRIDVLFLRGECMHTGHTKTMVDTALAVERACVIYPEKTWKSAGGPDYVKTSVIDRCLARMAVWVRLAGERLAVEFPSWRVLHSFQVFDLLQAMKKSKAQHDAQVGHLKVDLKKLAEIFRLDLDKLFAQFLALRSNALHVLETGRAACNADAWVAARKHLQDRRMRHHDSSIVDELLTASSPLWSHQ